MWHTFSGACFLCCAKQKMCLQRAVILCSHTSSVSLHCELQLLCREGKWLCWCRQAANAINLIFLLGWRPCRLLQKATLLLKQLGFKERPKSKLVVIPQSCCSTSCLNGSFCPCSRPWYLKFSACVLCLWTGFGIQESICKIAPYATEEQN